MRMFFLFFERKYLCFIVVESYKLQVYHHPSLKSWRVNGFKILFFSLDTLISLQYYNNNVVIYPYSPRVGNVLLQKTKLMSMYM